MKRFWAIFFILLWLFLFSCDFLFEPELPVYGWDGLTSVFFGDGAYLALNSMAPTTLPLSERLNILIIAEGYMQVDLDAGVFDSDVASWIEDAEAVEPLKHNKELFNIWSYKIASNEHVIEDDTRVADTAFSVPILASGSVGTELDTTTVRTWKLLRDIDMVISSYYPSGGKTHYINKKLIVVFLIYDPETRASGFSGRSRRLANPATDTQQISAAFGLNATHEFLHAFARLSDEYLEDDNGTHGYPNEDVTTAPYLVNVVDQANCTTLPWKHLLKGQGFHNVDNFVGAFGNAQNGYHSEAQCLMNGTHDNAAYFPGYSNLRVYDRLCNWCREITAIRLFERINVFTNPATDYTTWVNEYRSNFYGYYGFVIPASILPITPVCQ